MKKFRVKYALSGGFGGTEYADWEEIEAYDEKEAVEYAYWRAVEVYESYSGLHGLRTVEDIMEEDGVDEEEAEERYRDERESWLDYEVEEILE